MHQSHEISFFPIARSRTRTFDFVSVGGYRSLDVRDLTSRLKDGPSVELILRQIFNQSRRNSTAIRLKREPVKHYLHEL